MEYISANQSLDLLAAFFLFFQANNMAASNHTVKKISVVNRGTGSVLLEGLPGKKGK